MTYIEIITRIHAILEALEVEIEGIPIRFVSGQSLLLGEPDQIQNWPFIYSIFDRQQPDEPAHDLYEKKYTSLHRICFQTQNKQLVERQLAHLVDVIPDILDEEFYELTVNDVDSGWANVAGIQCRALDIITEVTC